MDKLRKPKKAKRLAKKAAPVAPVPVPPTLDFLSEKLGVQARQVSNLLRLGMPRLWPEAGAWHVEHRASVEAKKFQPRRQSAGKVREQELKNAILEFDLAEKKKSLVSTVEARQRYRNLAMQAAGAIKALQQYKDRLLGVTDPATLDERLEWIQNRQLATLRGEEFDDEPLSDPDDVVETAAA